MNMYKTITRIEQIGGMILIGILITGCLYVLKPFVTSILLGGVLCYSAWPAYLQLNQMLKKKRTITAFIMSALIAAILITPFLYVSLSFAENLQTLANYILEWAVKGPHEAPLWLKKTPFVGDSLVVYWKEWSVHTDKFNELFKKTLSQSQIRTFLIQCGLDLGHGIMQLSLSVFMCFFFFRHGEAIFRLLSEGMKRLAGSQTAHYFQVVGRTIRGVVYGIIGTAIAQGILAAYGFYVAGVPSALMLGVLTFFLSLITIPGGPAFVWLPAAGYLYMNGKTGFSIFIFFYGMLIISGVDNLLKPYLISRELKMPFALIFFGVLGGLLAFGFIGFFIGPTLLVIGYSLLKEWIMIKRTHPSPLPTDSR
ncbi:MAG: AI-2E family transporter [Candidatus Aureabacteria bacterium]|nr:AI-2E family transporter [Candidatus Auribacterota bacterium]